MTLLELINGKNYVTVEKNFCIIIKDYKYIVLKDVHLSIEKRPGVYPTYYIYDRNSNINFWISHFEINKTFIGCDLKELIKEFNEQIEQNLLLGYISSLNRRVNERFKAFNKFKEKYDLSEPNLNLLCTQLKGKNDIKEKDEIYIISNNEVKKVEVSSCDSYYISYINIWTYGCTRDSLEFGLTEKEAIENYYTHLLGEYNLEKYQLDTFQNIYNNYISSIQNITDFEREFDKNNRSV